MVKSPRASLTIDLLTDQDFCTLMTTAEGREAFGVFVAILVAGRDRLQRDRAERIEGTDALRFLDRLPHLATLTRTTEAIIRHTVDVMGQLIQCTGDEPWLSIQPDGRLVIRSFFKFNTSESWGGSRPSAGRRNQDEFKLNQLDSSKAESRETKSDQLDPCALASASALATALASPQPPTGGGGGAGEIQTRSEPRGIVRIPDSWAMAGAEGPIADLVDRYGAEWTQAAVDVAIAKGTRSNPAAFVGGVLRRFQAQGGPDATPTLKLATAPALPPETEEERLARLARWGAEEDAIKARNAARKGA